MSECKVNNDEALEKWRKRLIFRSNHRGTKEMDLVLGSFADQKVPGFNEDMLREYEEILTQNDPNLYNWLTGKEEPPKEVGALTVFQMLMEHNFV